MSCCSDVSIVTRLRYRVQTPKEARDVSLLLNFQTGSRANPNSYAAGNGDYFLERRVAGGVGLTIGLHLMLRLRMYGAIHSLPPCVLLACTYISMYIFLLNIAH